jgi:ER membrane protein complex subunit 1
MSVYNSKGVKMFTREEGLAYIVSVEMVDFPLLHLQEEFEDEFATSTTDNIITMFIKRLRSQFYQLIEFVTIDLKVKMIHLMNLPQHKDTLRNGPTSTVTNPEAPLLEDLTRDEFNMNKIIVAVTSVGKVFGIYTNENGPILWSFHLKNTESFKISSVKGKETVPFFIQRTSAHVPHEPQCVVIYKTQETKSLIHYFNPLTGEASRTDKSSIVDYQIKQVSLYHSPNKNSLKPLIVLDTLHKLHILPESSKSLILNEDDSVSSNNKPNILFTTNNENEKTSSLIGLAMKQTNNNEELPEIWRINFEDEKIITIGTKAHNDRIHSHGKVLGDRSVLYKYLNPNMIGVVTTGQDSQKIPFINVYIIDAVTGATITNFNHKRCEGPVNIVHSENWFFVSDIPFEFHYYYYYFKFCFWVFSIRFIVLNIVDLK